MEVDVQHFKIHLDPFGGDECFKIELCEEEEDKRSEVNLSSTGEESVYVINDSYNIVPLSRAGKISPVGSKSFVINYSLKNHSYKGKSTRKCIVPVHVNKQKIVDGSLKQATTKVSTRLDGFPSFNSKPNSHTYSLKNNHCQGKPTGNCVVPVSEEETINLPIKQEITADSVKLEDNLCKGDKSTGDCVLAPITVKQESEDCVVVEEPLIGLLERSKDKSSSDCIFSAITVKQESEDPVVVEEPLIGQLEPSQCVPSSISNSLTTDICSENDHCLKRNSSTDGNLAVSIINQESDSSVTKLEPNVNPLEPYRLECHTFKSDNEHNSNKSLAGGRSVAYAVMQIQTDECGDTRDGDVSSAIAKTKPASDIVITKYIEYRSRRNLGFNKTITYRPNSLKHCSYHCKFCGQTFDLINLMKEHIRANHPRGNAFVCDQCNFTANGKMNLEKHMRIHRTYRAPDIHCPVCNKLFKQNCRLKRHMLVHSEEYPFACHLCDYKGKSKLHLKQHSEIHGDNNTYFCHLCDYKVKYKRNLRTHIRFQHDQSGTVLTCNVCPFKTVNKKSLESHYESGNHRIRRLRACILNKDDMNYYHCPQCDYKGLTRGSVHAHRQVKHGPDKVYICEYCDFTTHMYSNFHQHKAVHVNIGKYQCDVCNLNFKRLHGLRQHSLTVHEKLRPFSCTQCEYSAALKSDLKRHVQAMHDRIKPFVCSLCGYCATQRNILVRHIDINHYNIKPYNCHYCVVYGTSTKQLLVKHIKSKHKKEICRNRGSYKPS